MAPAVVRIGNCSGRSVDKFKKFKLTAVNGEQVKAPLIQECFASFECKLVDNSLIRKYSHFVFEVVKAHVPDKPKFPKTIHYRGHGLFMIAGETTDKYRRLFKSSMLEE